MALQQYPHVCLRCSCMSHLHTIAFMQLTTNCAVDTSTHTCKQTNLPSNKLVLILRKLANCLHLYTFPKGCYMPFPLGVHRHTLLKGSDDWITTIPPPPPPLADACCCLTLILLVCCPVALPDMWPCIFCFHTVLLVCCAVIYTAVLLVYCTTGLQYCDLLVSCTAQDLLYCWSTVLQCSSTVLLVCCTASLL